MSLTVVTGRANAGKSGVIDARLSAAVARGGRAVLLLPAEPDVVRARSFLDASLAGDVTVEQLDRHVRSLWSLYGDGRRLVGDAYRDALVARAHDGVPPDCLAGLEGSVGVRRLAAELAEMSAAAGWPAGPSPASRHAADLVRLVRAYRDLLDGLGLVEPGEAWHVLASTRSALHADLVVVHRFVDLTPAQEALVRGWHEMGIEVIVSLPYDEDAPGTTATAPLVQRLADAGAQRVHVDTAPEGTERELTALEAGVFASVGTSAATDAVAFAAAAGEDGEARVIAREVALAIDAGTPPERIAVVFRDGQRHLAWLSSAFSEIGVPADYMVSTPVAQTAFGRALSHLWSFAAGPMDRHDLLAFLRSPFSGADPGAVDAIDAEWRRSRIDAGPGLLGPLERCGPDAREAVRAAGRAKGAVLDARAASELTRVADRMLADAWPGDAPLLGADGQFDAAVHRALCEAITEMAALDGGITCDEVVESVLASAVFPRTPERPGHVQVMDAIRSRSRRFDMVVLGGLTGGEFPAGTGEDRMGGPAVSQAAAALGVGLDAAGRAAHERLMLYQIVTRPRRRLLLTRHATTPDGAEVPRSVFWDEVADLYRDPDEEMWEPRKPLLLDAPSMDGPRRTSARHRARLARPGNLEHLAGRQVFSASEIETYLRCPYQWFQTRAVASRNIDAELDAKARGRLIHDVLHDFYHRLPEETGSQRVTRGTADAAMRLAARLCNDYLATGPEPASLEEEADLRLAADAVLAFVAREADFLPDFVPAHLEWSFGAGDDEPEDLGPFSLRGRIDRIDHGPDGLVLIDYKSGGVCGCNSWEKEKLVQIPLYALVARRRLGLPVVGGLYRSVAKCADRGLVLAGVWDRTSGRDVMPDEHAFDGVLDEALDRASAAVQGMRAGDISPLPEKRRCGYCDFASACPAVGR